jgi:hypothetical protein
MVPIQKRPRWVWLEHASIGMFTRQSLRRFNDAGRDAHYDVQARERLSSQVGLIVWN